jgi:hypothetical protein
MGERDDSESWCRLLGGTAVKPVDVESRLRQFAWPAPSAELRTRVLSAVPATSPAVSWSDRVWFSRAWRLAAIAAVVVLIALEQLAGPGGAVSRAVAAPIPEDVRVIAEAAREAGLPADQAQVAARRMVSATERSRTNARSWELGLAALGVEGEER